MLFENCSLGLYIHLESSGKIGTRSLVARLVEAGNKENKIDRNTPYAELWMGTHHLHSSKDARTRIPLRKTVELPFFVQDSLNWDSHLHPSTPR